MGNSHDTRHHGEVDPGGRGCDDDVAPLIESAGLDFVSRMVIDEIAHRFDHPPISHSEETKALVDGLNHQDILDEAGRPAGEFDLSIKGIHFYHNVVFIEKGRNAEPEGPDWVGYPRR